jgi:hypothetical protein
VRARRMVVNLSVFRRAAVLAAAMAMAGAAGGCGSVRAGHEPAGAASGVSASGWRVIRGAPVRSVIVIAPGETFAPPPAWAKPKLDGVQAWHESFLGRGKGAPGGFLRMSAISLVC